MGCTTGVNYLWQFWWSRCYFTGMFCHTPFLSLLLAEVGKMSHGSNLCFFDLPPPYILQQDRLAAIWVKNSLMVWYLLCLLCQNYQLLSHNFTSNLFAQSTSRLCRGVRNMQNAIMFKERQIIKFGFVMELKVSLKISYVFNQGSGHIWTIYLQFNEARSNWYC